MKQSLAAVLSCAVLLLVGAGFVHAYSIDGDDDDWVSGYASENIDGDSPAEAKYDIYVNRSNQESGTWYFYFRTMGYYPTGNSGDFAEIYINSDRSGATGAPFSGIPGFDYKLKWDLGTNSAETVTGDADLYEWNPVTEEWDLTGNSYSVARGLAADTGPNGNEMFVEWSLPGTAIGSPGNIEWGAYLDDNSLGQDDLCPDEMDQPGVPEPSTLLLVLGPVGIMLLKRRRGEG